MNPRVRRDQAVGSWVGVLCMALLGAIAPSSAAAVSGLSTAGYNYDAKDVASLITNSTTARGPPARTDAPTVLSSVEFQSYGALALREVAVDHDENTYEASGSFAHVDSITGTTNKPTQATSGDLPSLQWRHVAAKAETGLGRLTIKVGKQDKHIPGTNNFIRGRSELTANPNNYSAGPVAARLSTTFREAPPISRKGLTLVQQLAGFLRAAVSTPIRRPGSSTTRPTERCTSFPRGHCHD